MIDLSGLSAPLTINQIDFRVQSINKGGYATIIAYKDARVDMQRLDDVVGPLWWKREHCRENHNCTVSIFNKDIEQWVHKEDTGTESMTESEKGLASDSFKRACFNWGIGRELYDYPLIRVKLNDVEWDDSSGKPRATWRLNLRSWQWISEWVDGNLVYLAAKDNKSLRYEWYDETEQMVEAGIRLNDCFDMDDLPGAAELYMEWSQGELMVICRAPSKGGQLSTNNRTKLKSTEFRHALNEARGI